MNGRRLLVGAALAPLSAGAGLFTASVSHPDATYREAAVGAAWYLAGQALFVGFMRFVVVPALGRPRPSQLRAGPRLGGLVLIAAVCIGWFLLLPNDPGPQRVGVLLAGCGALLGAIATVGPALAERRHRDRPATTEGCSDR